VRWHGPALAAIVAASAWIRRPGFLQGGFASHDVGGILYNAMLLRSGGLPYVDSVEFKAPGSFYLAALLAGPEGRDIAAFQVAANLVGLASLIAVAAVAWRLWGGAGAVLAAALYALHDAALDRMDANYVTWAQLPQVLALLVAVAAARAPASAWRWALAGALAGAAALCKQPAGIVLLPLLVWAARARVRDGRRLDLAAAAATLAGFLAAHAPVALHYLARGELAALVRGYAFNPWSLAYITERDGAGAFEPWEGLAATLHTLALPLALAGLAAARRLSARTGPDGHVPEDIHLRLWLWWAAALAAACVGLRFYRGYFLAALPPLCVLAAAPWGVRGLPRPRSRGAWLRTALLTAALATLTLRAVVDLAKVRADREGRHDHGARRIARWIDAHAAPGERIWVWGWHLWGVYAYTGRLAGSRVYKTMGLLTPPNDDTWRRPARAPAVLADNPWMRVLLADLQRTRPAAIVLGGTAPRRGIDDLRAWLRAHYRQDACNIDRVQCWLRR
jgi:hypothetical protein